jgi:hypothetical protein
MGFVLTEHEWVEGDREWVFAVKARGRELNVGERIPIDVPITLVVGKGEEEDTNIALDFTYDSLIIDSNTDESINDFFE